MNGDALIIGASTNHAHSITNTQLGGASSVFLEAKSGANASEKGQISCGGGGGLRIRTNTEHPIKFTTYNYAPDSEFVAIQPSMQILANTERDVEILAPLKVKGRTTIIGNTLTVGVLADLEDEEFHVMASSQIDGNLVVDGNINCGGNLLIGTTNVATALGEKATTANLDLKAPKVSPAFAGTATAVDLTVSGTLRIGTTNVATVLGEKATTAALDLKAPKESPTFTGIATAAALTVNGALLVGTTNVATALGEKATTAALDLKAPKENPTFTGTATAAALTVNAALRVGTTNVMSALNLKANTSDSYTKTQIETTLQPKISAFNAPLKYTSNLLTGFNSLSIDPTVFQPVMPWASCLITTASNGTAFVFSFGFQTITGDNLTRVGTGNKAYKITFPSPHPNGSLFAVMAVPYTGSSDSSGWDYTLSTDYICTTKAEGSTGMSVWCRRPIVSNAVGMIHGSFYVYTVP